MENSIIDQGEINIEPENNLPAAAEKYLKEANGCKQFIAIFILVLVSIYLVILAVSLIATFSISQSSYGLLSILVIIVFAFFFGLPGYLLYISTKSFKKYFLSGSNYDFTVALENDKRFWKVVAIYTIIQVSLTGISVLLKLMS